MQVNVSLCLSLSFSLNSLTSVDARHDSINSTGSDGSSSSHCPLLAVDPKNFKAMWNEEVSQNRERWKAHAAKGTHGLVPWSHLDFSETLGRLVEQDAAICKIRGLTPRGQKDDSVYLYCRLLWVNSIC